MGDQSSPTDSPRCTKIFQPVVTPKKTSSKKPGNKITKKKPLKLFHNENDPLPVEETPKLFSMSGKFRPGLDLVIGVDGIGKNKTPPASSITITVADEIDPSVVEYKDLVKKGDLGQGSTGTVTRMQHKISKMDYALKKVTPAKNSEIDNSKVILAEFKSLYECNCPNVVKMYNTYYVEGQICMLIEYMDCGSLEDVMKHCPDIPESIISKISAQILHGLTYLHEEKSIVHRDLKPPNILINSQGIAKIADFGMAGQKEGVTRDNWVTFQGTYAYMSPERIRGEAHSFDSDIWALGVTLAQCALGKFPFEVTEGTIWEIMKRLSSNEPFHLPEHFSPEFKDFIYLCTKFTSKDRPNARSLLEHEFITKNVEQSPSLRKWMQTVYVAKRKERREEKKRKQSLKEG
ncbi:mitogen-activated protein kinase kinase [Acrasis kona]|uniref:mitogen-activated protein kinase kinase n=1 Tax=Acrasis kona TaxID=1008807 RepID=A0AAW2YHN1_9EUKA